MWLASRLKVSDGMLWSLSLSDLATFMEQDTAAAKRARRRRSGQDEQTRYFSGANLDRFGRG